MSTPEPTGLEKAADRTPAIIRTPEEYRSALLRWQQLGFHVLSPFSNFSSLAESHGLIASLVQISTDKQDEEVYDGRESGRDGMPWLKEGEVALAKRGLRKIMECGGISSRNERTDPRTIPHFWEFKSVGSYRGTDGSIVTREAHMEWDLREGSQRLKGFGLNQINEARKNGLRSCETRAVNAMVRECGCGLKQKYTREELKKPFVVVRVMYMPDTSDPETRKILTEGYLRGTAAMYPSARELPSHDYIDAEPAGEPQASASSPATGSASATTTAPDPNKPPTPDAVRIIKVDTKEGETQGRKWTRFSITDSNGAEHSTFDKTIADFAAKAVQSKAWVEIAEETDGQYKNLVEITAAGSQPSLLPDPSAL